MSRRGRVTDPADPEAEAFDRTVEAVARVRAAERQAGVCLTPEWRAFFVALADPAEPEPEKTE